MLPTGASVLIADDSDDLREMLEEYLVYAGYRVRTATDGDDALRQFLAEPSDVVITDLQMPKQNGLQVLRGVQAARPGTPVILLTGQGTTASAIDEARRLGIFLCLTKPLADLRVLPQVMADALAAGRTQPGN